MLVVVARGGKDRSSYVLRRRLKLHTDGEGAAVELTTNLLAENGLASIACKLLCCSFSYWSIVSLSTLPLAAVRSGPEPSEGKHSTDSNADCWCVFMLLLEILSRHCRDMAQRTIGVEDPQNPLRQL